MADLHDVRLPFSSSFFRLLICFSCSFGTFNWAMLVHIIFMYPETVGRSLEEVEEIFKQGHTFSAWKIGKNVGKKTVEDVLQGKNERGSISSSSEKA